MTSKVSLILSLEMLRRGGEECGGEMRGFPLPNRLESGERRELFQRDPEQSRHRMSLAEIFQTQAIVCVGLCVLSLWGEGLFGPSKYAPKFKQAARCPINPENYVRLT